MINKIYFLMTLFLVTSCGSGGNSVNNIQNNDAELFLFDKLSLNEFKDGKSERNQLHRNQELSQWYNENKNFIPNVKLLESQLINLDTNKGLLQYK